MFPYVDVSDFDHSDLFIFVYLFIYFFFRAVHIDFASPRHHTAINSLASFSQILGISHEPEGTINCGQQAGKNRKPATSRTE